MSNTKKAVVDTLLVIVGNAVLAFGYAAFAIPSNLIVGGATGLSLVMSQLSGINYATIVFVINMIMLVLGYIILGKKFAAGTILSSFIFPMFLGLFQTIPGINHVTNDMLLSVIYTGLFIGLGSGIVFRLGYSTGGMDVPPVILNKKTGISIAMGVNVLDILILLSQTFFSNFEGILYGILAVFITTFVLDQVIVLGQKNLQVLVISQKHEAIAQAIFDEIDRGCTFVNVTTGYFHDPQKAVLCVLDNRQSAKVHDVVMKIDPTAFIIETEIHSVKGRGFTLPNVDLDKQLRDHL